MYAVSTTQRSEFLELAYECLYAHNMRLHAQTEEALDGNLNLPAWYQKDLLALRKNLEDSLCRPTDVIPEDLHSVSDGQGPVTVAQQYIADFAALLDSWPAMWKACAALGLKERASMLGIAKEVA